MRAMKDSGIAWIGEIPEDWEIARIKQLFSEVNDRCESSENYTLLSVSEYYGIAPKSEKISDDDMLTHAETLDGYKICKENDLVMNIMLAWKRALGVSKYVGIVSPAYCVFRKKRNMYVKYFHYLFRTDIYANLFKQYSTGIIDSRLRLYPDKFLSLKCQAPPLDIQHRIADYLDRKCSQIDAIIARQQEVIEKLKAYKLSVITEAVTKGLNPHAPMKDSGVEWIGEIPADWEVSKLKFMGHFVNGYAFSSNSFTTDGVRVMKIANIQPMRISWIDASYVDTSEYNRLSMYRVEQGDLVFALTRPIINGGIKVAIFDGKDKVLLNQRNAMFKGLSRVLSRWMYYVMQNQMYVQEFALYIDATGQQPNISTNEISQIKIPIPPIEVQQEIIMKLDAIMASIEKLISRKEQVIQRLSDYKKSLIYEVVTGKKEV